MAFALTAEITLWDTRMFERNISRSSSSCVQARREAELSGGGGSLATSTSIWAWMMGSKNREGGRRPDSLGGNGNRGGGGNLSGGGIQRDGTRCGDGVAGRLRRSLTCKRLQQLGINRGQIHVVCLVVLPVAGNVRVSCHFLLRATGPEEDGWALVGRVLV
jgi:hypothetical protein